MSAEYFKEKQSAMERLASACASNLRSMKESGQTGYFSFKDNWKSAKQHRRTHPQNPVLNPLSRFALSFNVLTWVTYQYWDGNISAALMQEIKSEARLVQLHESVEVEEIPFDKFSEADLVDAAKTIEKNMKFPAPA